MFKWIKKNISREYNSWSVMDNKLSRLKGLFDLGIFLFSVVIGTLTQKQVNISVCLGVKTCEVFLCLVAIVRIRVHYLDFFVLHH